VSGKSQAEWYEVLDGSMATAGSISRRERKLHDIAARIAGFLPPCGKRPMAMK
jgi:hypothetical protein